LPLQACAACEGAGVRSTPCKSCGGDGRVRKSRKIRVTVPAGIEEGMRLRISDEGSVGRKGGPPGDLYVMMSVKAHPELKRDGQTIYSDVSVRIITLSGC
jgi:molecular chaperone DnaJ